MKKNILANKIGFIINNFETKEIIKELKELLGEPVRWTNNKIIFEHDGKRYTLLRKNGSRGVIIENSLDAS